MKFRENLVISKNSKIVMFNLISFRRKFISEKEYCLLKCMLEKEVGCYNEEEAEFLKSLYIEKQLLKDEDRQLFEEEMRKCFHNAAKKNVRAIMINLTYSCNVNCKYCYQRGKHKKIKKRMTVEDIDKIRNTVCYINSVLNDEMVKEPDIKYIDISGGESLLPENLSIIRRITEVFPKSEIMIATNGINLEDMWDELPLHRISGFQISLDGIKEVHEELSGVGEKCNYYKIVQGIEHALKMGYEVKLVTIMVDKYIEDINSRMGSIQQNIMMCCSYGEDVSARICYADFLG